MSETGRELELTVCDLNVDGSSVAKADKPAVGSSLAKEDNPVVGGAAANADKTENAEEPDRRVFFLDRGLPGERVRAVITGQKKRIFFGRVVQSLSPSPDKVESFCPYYSVCGGCAMQDLAYPAQLALKQRRVAATLSRLGRVTNFFAIMCGSVSGEPGDAASGELRDDLLKTNDDLLKTNDDLLKTNDGLQDNPMGDALPEIIPAPRLQGYRNKMEYAFGLGDKSELVLGLRRRAVRQGPDTALPQGLRSAARPGLDADLPQGLRRVAPQVLDIEACPLQSAHSGQILQVVRQWVREGNYSVWQDADGRHRKSIGGGSEGDFGCLRYLVLREPEYVVPEYLPSDGNMPEHFPQDGKRQCSVELICGNKLPPSKAVDELWRRLAQAGVTSFLLGERLSAYNVAKSERVVKSFGQPGLWEKFGPLLLELPPTGFAQTNTEVAALLYERVAALAALEDFGGEYDGETGGKRGGARLWDLYCGSGALALRLAPACASVLGIELEAEAVAAARANAARLGLRNCTFKCGDAAKLLAGQILDAPDAGIAAAQRNLQQGRKRLADAPEAGIAAAQRNLQHQRKHSLHPSDMAESGAPGTGFVDAQGPDVLIADPPRAGMSPQVLAAIKKRAPRRIIYISCDPATLARDLAEFSSNYDLSALVLADMFPHTTHVESVVRLDLRNK